MTVRGDLLGGLLRQRAPGCKISATGDVVFESPRGSSKGTYVVLFDPSFRSSFEPHWVDRRVSAWGSSAASSRTAEEAHGGRSLGVIDVPLLKPLACRSFDQGGANRRRFDRFEKNLEGTPSGGLLDLWSRK